jgi:hypothetical protein
MLRLLAFILAILLLAGSVEPTQGWLITLVVLTGLAAIRFRPWRVMVIKPAVDVRLAAFVLAILLLAGTVDANRDWLIALTAVTGVAAFCPRVIALNLFGEDESNWERRGRRWQVRMQRDWDRWERRMDRELNRHWRRRSWNDRGEDWS